MAKKTQQLRSGRFVSPGERLGVIEEFMPGRGIYVDEGALYSSITGHIVFDIAKRELHIESRTRQPLIPKEGDVIIGKVTSIQDKTLTGKIIQIRDIQLSTLFTGIMHISDVSRGYVRTMNDAFKTGDFIRARVISTKNREFHLTTRDNELGVLQAFCSNCGAILARMRCTRCNKINKRKMVDVSGRSFS